MSKRWAFFCLLPFLVSCEKDWNSVEDWQELYAVYGTLNLKDTAQYLRISRVFGATVDPSDYYQQADCVHVDINAIRVILECWKGELLNGPVIEMVPTHDFIKEPGLFTNDDYWVYKTTEPLKIDSRYRLRVQNIVTGYEMTAETNLLGRRTLAYSFKEMRSFNVTQYKPELLDYNGSLIPGQFEKMIQRLLYLEITPTDTFQRIIDWRPWLDHTKQSTDDTVQQLSRDFYQFLGENIPVKPGIIRVAVGVDKLLILNNEELQLYVELTEAQSTPNYMTDYTNFDRGKGIFGSRYYYTHFAMKLKVATLDSLATGQYTRNLGFIGSKNYQTTEK